MGNWELGIGVNNQVKRSHTWLFTTKARSPLAPLEKQGGFIVGKRNLKLPKLSLKDWLALGRRYVVALKRSFLIL
ncbi:MAG: hypothetical protein EAZ90_09450 [Oscillatoriales cyanobacterium]|nr:MAG: hypothetical protein EAZ94_09560 [Oscillatoriales cyanobacterium]TAE21106.1 MAG: hypothetical protein EAZ93_21760 [Oscillatoriales cyanobacterium]TAE43845.1 MAG: hypothetical protein EAZ90_09450 [Oscillatoriales cyanobacterium]TAE52984.1 MAG: hypothetical protein EAZ88_13310 [Oscillatoriales cyanobacterium]TAE67962.1 MAG: hypothetical protein EAZ86_14630 [Oscillatoriales cyanobacterium]